MRFSIDQVRMLEHLGHFDVIDNWVSKIEKESSEYVYPNVVRDSNHSDSSILVKKENVK
jgi:hypothetical protein